MKAPRRSAFPCGYGLAPRAPRRRLFRVMALAILCAAPVPGDIGACGQKVQELDPERFFRARKAVDCDRCTECGFATEACRSACDARAPWETEFPEGCLPLVHDGEVCLRVLLYASCSDYGSYVDDDRPEVPTECNFCAPEERPR